MHYSYFKREITLHYHWRILDRFLPTVIPCTAEGKRRNEEWENKRPPSTALNIKIRNEFTVSIKVQAEFGCLTFSFLKAGFPSLIKP